jgi:hypothetical protein
MKQLLSNLLSRKFLLALGTALVCYAHGDYLGLVTVVLAYIGANAYVTAQTNQPA